MSPILIRLSPRDAHQSGEDVHYSHLWKLPELSLFSPLALAREPLSMESPDLSSSRPPDPHTPGIHVNGATLGSPQHKEPGAPDKL
ncbi:unnamed protein product [Merluccius merluccius]